MNEKRYFIDLNQDLEKKNSRDLHLSYLNNKVATGFKSGLHTCMIPIDLQKAFDTINHEVVINIMEYLGFSKDVILWFKSYLSNRKIKVNLNSFFGNCKTFMQRTFILKDLF